MTFTVNAGLVNSGLAPSMIIVTYSRAVTASDGVFAKSLRVADIRAGYATRPRR